MDKFTKYSQILKLLLILAFLVMTPLLSTSLRPTYLYFILNLLIIALGTEAGFLSSISNSADEKKPYAENPAIIIEAAKPSDKKEAMIWHNRYELGSHVIKRNEEEVMSDKPKAKVVQKCLSEKINFVSSLKHKVIRRCPSTPSLFFIGGDENETEEVIENTNIHIVENHLSRYNDQKDVEEISGQELYHKAETFIGNFYKQLKMQREDSWKKLHDIYQKAF